MVADGAIHNMISSIFKSSECRERCPSVPWEFDIIHGFGLPRSSAPTAEDVKLQLFLCSPGSLTDIRLKKF